MMWSAKAADLRRDQRYVLHSIVTGPDSGEGEIKLHGIAAEAGSGLGGDAAEAWWPDKAIVYVLRIGQALFVAWDIERGMMAVHRWSRETATAIPHAPTLGAVAKLGNGMPSGRCGHGDRRREFAPPACH
jgi:hypothetical protein